MSDPEPTSGLEIQLWQSIERLFYTREARRRQRHAMATSEP